ncbi:MAG: hypothetical protein WD334_04710 [Chitinophagales bacterium]
MMNLYSREEYVERRKMLRWFLDQVNTEDMRSSETDEMIGFVIDQLGLSFSDLEIICISPDSYNIAAFEDEEEKWVFYYQFLSAMNFEKNLSAKESEICRLIASKLEMEENFVNALLTILPQYIRRKIPDTVIKHSVGAIKKSMVAAAMVVPIGYVIGMSYS